MKDTAAAEGGIVVTFQLESVMWWLSVVICFGGMAFGQQCTDDCTTTTGPTSSLSKDMEAPEGAEAYTVDLSWNYYPPTSPEVQSDPRYPLVQLGPVKLPRTAKEQRRLSRLKKLPVSLRIQEPDMVYFDAGTSSWRRLGRALRDVGADEALIKKVVDHRWLMTKAYNYPESYSLWQINAREEALLALIESSGHQDASVDIVNRLKDIHASRAKLFASGWM